MNFDLMINIDPINLVFPYYMSVKFGLWTFHKLWKRQKSFDFIDFGWPNRDKLSHLAPMSIEYDILRDIDIDMLINKFARDESHKGPGL